MDLPVYVGPCDQVIQHLESYAKAMLPPESRALTLGSYTYMPLHLSRATWLMSMNTMRWLPSPQGHVTHKHGIYASLYFHFFNCQTIHRTLGACIQKWIRGRKIRNFLIEISESVLIIALGVAIAMNFCIKDGVLILSHFASGLRFV